MDDGEICTTMWMYLVLLNCTAKYFKNSMFYVDFTIVKKMQRNSQDRWNVKTIWRSWMQVCGPCDCAVAVGRPCVWLWASWKASWKGNSNLAMREKKNHQFLWKANISQCLTPLWGCTDNRNCSQQWPLQHHSKLRSGFLISHFLACDFQNLVLMGACHLGSTWSKDTALYGCLDFGLGWWEQTLLVSQKTHVFWRKLQR